jgi:hypothetical protein
MIKIRPVSVDYERYIMESVISWTCLELGVNNTKEKMNFFRKYITQSYRKTKIRL